ncbi:MAG: hypothetical protein IPH07_11030 [Deltaproteobacteria bacterium]|nr:hypothetical protein [Deltaproteobacteria bacterium]MBP7285401.1 hypothetical protein [Nannocystaceae bacterium]
MQLAALLTAAVCALAKPAPTTGDPDEPTDRGAALLGSAGAASGGALVLLIVRNVLLDRSCPLDGSSTRCTARGDVESALVGTQLALETAAVGLAAGGGVVLGRNHGWHDARAWRERPIRRIIGGGVTLVVVGAGGIAGAIALQFTSLSHCVSAEIDSGDALAGDRCIKRRYPAWTTMHWLSFTAVAAGAAILGYGTAHRRQARRFGGGAMRLAPSFARDGGGLSLVGRF